MPLVVAAICLLSPRVTLQIRAQPLEKVVATIAQRTGRSLGVQAALAKEWIVIDAKDADPQELLDRIAEVTYAKWDDDGRTLRLRRSAEEERRSAREERAFHVQNLRQDVARQRGAAHANPRLRLLHDLVAELPLETLVGADAPLSTKFIEPPLGIQTPLPPKAREIAERIVGLDTGDSPFPFELRVIQLVDAFGEVGLLAGASIVDAQGLENDDLVAKYDSWREKPVLLPVPPPKPVDFSPVSVEIERLGIDDVTFRELSKPAKDAFLHPEWGGRIAGAWTDAVLDRARKEGRMLVACLPDALEDTGLGLGDPPTEPEVTQSLRPFTLERPGGWLTFRRRFPVPLSQARADRIAMGKTLRKLARGEPIPLEEAASLMPRVRPLRAGFLGSARCLDDSHRLLTEALYADEFGLALLRQIPPSTLSSLTGASPIAMKDLPVPVQECLRNELLTPGREEWAARSEADSDGTRRVRTRDSIINPRDVGKLRLGVEVQYETQVIRRKSGAPDDSELSSLSEFKRTVDGDWRPMVWTARGETEAYDLARPCRIRNLTFRILLASGYEWSTTLQDCAFFPGVGFMPPARLPKWVKDVVRAAE